MAWFKRLARPIALPDGELLLTLRDAADFIAALPAADRGSIAWDIAQTAVEMAAEGRVDVALASAAVMHALGSPSLPTAQASMLRIVR